MPSVEDELLKVWERWLYGGLGSLAPVIVALLAVDLATVFRGADAPAVMGWVTRSLLLFAIGGFVAFLHKKETDTWRCFVIGISAPALITTAISGKQLNQALSAFPVVNTAFAGNPAQPTTRPEDIKLIRLSEIAESAFSKFERGFYGRDPSKTYVFITLDTDKQRATQLAASVYRYSQCALRDGKNKRFANIPELGDLEPPFVIEYLDTFAIVSLFINPKAASGYVAFLRRERLSDDFVLDSISTSWSKAQSDLNFNIFDGLGSSGDEDAASKRVVENWAALAQRQCNLVGVGR